MSIPQIPAERLSTHADGRINFRVCLAMGRDYLGRGPMPAKGMSLAKAKEMVRRWVAAERARWDALSPSLRAAATRFDTAMGVRGIAARDAYGRDVAIDALGADRPAVWPTISMHPYFTEINTNVSAVYGTASSLTVFERLVAEERDFTTTLFALNAAGEKFLRNVRAARAYRKRPMIAAE